MPVAEKMIVRGGLGRAWSRGSRRGVSRGRAGARGVEALERRQLMSVVMSAPLANLSAFSGQYPTRINLNSSFSSTTVTGTAVEFDVTFGSTSGVIDVGLYNSATPITVANFLRYVNSGAYNGTVFDRSVAGSYVQGGGYYFPSGTAVPSNGGIVSEFSKSPRTAGSNGATSSVNVAGTIAMYKADGATNQATSQFVINAGDNSKAFDASPKQYTVFGRVLGSGMTLVNQINALQTEAFAPPFDQLPVTNYTTGTTLSQSNVVYVSSATVVNAISYVATSSAPELVTPIVLPDGTLSLTYQQNVVGTAQISVTATDLDGATLTTTFNVTVADAGTLSADYSGTRLDPAGSTVTAFGSIAVATGTSVTRQFTLTNVGSLDLSGITYSFSGSTSAYTLFNAPATSLISGNSTTVIVKIDTSSTGDKAGTLLITDPASSAPVLSIPMDAQIEQLVTLGGKLRTVTYAQGTGASATSATWTLGNAGTGTAQFSLSGAGLTTRTVGSSVLVSGNASLDSITLTSTTTKSALTLATKGATPISIGTVTGVGTASLGTFSAKNSTLTGSFTWGFTTATTAELNSLVLGTVSGASIIIGPSSASGAVFTMAAGAVSGTTLNVGNSIKSLTASSWSGGLIQCQQNIVAMALRSSVSTSVSVTGSIGTAKVSGALTGGEWDVAGNVRSISAASGASGYALSVSGIVSAASFAGDFSGAISASAIGTFSAASGTGTSLVAKGTTNASNVTTGAILKSIAFKGNVSAGYFNSANVIGSVTANSLTRTRIYAGTTIAANAVLPTAYSAFAATSEIGSIKLAGRGVANAFNLNVVAAETIVSASLGSILLTTGTANGFAASVIGSISGTANTASGRKLSGRNLRTQAAATAVLSSVAVGADFGITILPAS
jgi:cyclophilin family peptidyl-prolyl cis-trans isomerase